MVSPTQQDISSNVMNGEKHRIIEAAIYRVVKKSFENLKKKEDPNQ